MIEQKIAEIVSCGLATKKDCKLPYAGLFHKDCKDCMEEHLEALIANELAPLVRTLQVTSHALKSAGFSDGKGSVRELIDSTLKEVQHD